MYFSTTAEEKPELRDFFKYLEFKGTNEAEFVKASFQVKSEIFYRWKWGGSIHAHNMEAETTQRYLVNKIRLRGLENIVDEKERRFWQGELMFEDYCRKVMERIGIIKSPVATDETVRSVAQKFNGVVTSGYSRKDWVQE